MIAVVTPDMPILFLDTGFHFPDTLAYRDRLMTEWGLDVRSLTAKIGHEQFVVQYGQLYRTNPDQCCYVNKVLPLQEARKGLAAWITGIRRDQTAARRATPIVSQSEGGQYKICPMARWTERDVWRYINQHDLPVHSLLSQGYMSIGCAPCTQPMQVNGDARSGRWSGQEKTECGLHIDLPGVPAEVIQPEAKDGSEEHHV
jgi:phosphoadenosine phosphosulfate reductase